MNNKNNMNNKKKNNVVIYPCENVKYLDCIDSKSYNSGACLIVPVSIHNVCENEHLLVIVEVYKDNQFYSRQIKEIFTGSNNDHCNNNCCCCCYDSLIDNLFVDNFEFYFLDDCNPKCIYVEVKTQYIYSC